MDPYPFASISRECISCDACECSTSNPRLQCERCRTTYYCSVVCRRDHAQMHTCPDIKTLQNSIAGMEESHLLSSSPPTIKAIHSSCAICLEDPTTEQQVVLVDCRHGFCRSCLSEWHRYQQLANNGDGGSIGNRGGTCPCCRTKVSMLVPTSEKFWIDRAMLLGARAKTQKNGSSLKLETCQQALAELSKVLNNDNTCMNQQTTQSTTQQALFTKVEILLTLGEPKEAIAVLEIIMEVDKEGLKNRKRLEQYLDEMKKAMDVGNDGETERILHIIESIGGKEGENLKTATMGEEGRVGVQLKFAEALQQLKDWEGAKETYKKVLDLGSGLVLPLFVFLLLPFLLWAIALFIATEDSVAHRVLKYASKGLCCVGIFYMIFKTIRSSLILRKQENTFTFSPTNVQQRSCWSELCRCYYELGDYDRAIRAGSFALEMNRHYEGAHKYVALAHKAKGDLQQARRTMNRAVLYETPWDEDNRRTQAQLFREVCADADLAKKLL
jgi:tetratricopeptide (TPR) repeat protein